MDKKLYGWVLIILIAGLSAAYLLRPEPAGKVKEPVLYDEQVEHTDLSISLEELRTAIEENTGRQAEMLDAKEFQDRVYALHKVLPFEQEYGLSCFVKDGGAWRWQQTAVSKQLIQWDHAQGTVKYAVLGGAYNPDEAAYTVISHNRLIRYRVDAGQEYVFELIQVPGFRSGPGQTLRDALVQIGAMEPDRQWLEERLREQGVEAGVSQLSGRQTDFVVRVTGTEELLLLYLWKTDADKMRIQENLRMEGMLRSCVNCGPVYEEIHNGFLVQDPLMRAGDG